MEIIRNVNKLPTKHNKTYWYATFSYDEKNSTIHVRYTEQVYSEGNFNDYYCNSNGVVFYCVKNFEEFNSGIEQEAFKQMYNFYNEQSKILKKEKEVIDYKINKNNKILNGLDFTQREEKLKRILE